MWGQSWAIGSGSAPSLPSPSSASPLNMCWAYVLKILDSRRAKSWVCPICPQVPVPHCPHDCGWKLKWVTLWSHTLSPMSAYLRLVGEYSSPWILECWGIIRKILSPFSWAQVTFLWFHERCLLTRSSWNKNGNIWKFHVSDSNSGRLPKDWKVSYKLQVAYGYFYGFSTSYDEVGLVSVLFLFSLISPHSSYLWLLFFFSRTTIFTSFHSVPSSVCSSTPTKFQKHNVSKSVNTFYALFSANSL